MADRKIMMPATTAGITRYFDDYRSTLTFQPGHVLILAAVIVMIILLLQTYGGVLLGL